MSEILPTTGISPVDQATLPADVRKAGPQAERLYETATAFEQTLLQQLTQTLSDTTGLDGTDSGGGSDDGSGGDATTSTMMGMLPDAYAQSLTQAGGIGIARELYDAMKARGTA
jgi:hypothetical protein